MGFLQIYIIADVLHFSALAASGHNKQRLLQLGYVIERITLFTSADYRNHPKFYFLHGCSEHPESIQ